MVLEHAGVGAGEQDSDVAAVEIGAADAPSIRSLDRCVARLEPDELVDPGVADFGDAGPVVDQHPAVAVEPRIRCVVGIVEVAMRSERLVRAVPAVGIDDLAVVPVAEPEILAFLENAEVADTKFVGKLVARLGDDPQVAVSLTHRHQRAFPRQRNKVLNHARSIARQRELL